VDEAPQRYQELSDRIGRDHASICASQRDLLAAIAEAEVFSRWDDDGCRDMAHWVSTRLGITVTQAGRWVRAARALALLPHIDRAFGAGELCLDKVLELARFATPATDAALARWAARASVTVIRNRADRENRASVDETKDIHARRCVSWWRADEGKAIGLAAYLPAESGAVVVAALDRIAAGVAESPDDEPSDDDVFGGIGDPTRAERRRADALVVLASQGLAADPDKDRATVVIHAALDDLVAADGAGIGIDGGTAVHPEVARRLCCDARIQTVIEDGHGVPIGIGRVARTIPGWLRRLLIQRDGGCTFPGCAATRYLDGHHVKWWIDGGFTDLDNLTLTCGFHHRLVHEKRWTVRLDDHHRAQWFRPDGTRYELGIVTTRGPTGTSRPDPPAEGPAELGSEPTELATAIDPREGPDGGEDTEALEFEPLELTLFAPASDLPNGEANESNGEANESNGASSDASGVVSGVGSDEDVRCEDARSFAGAAF
jgi:hypothetical protein